VIQAGRFSSAPRKQGGPIRIEGGMEPFDLEAYLESAMKADEPPRRIRFGCCTSGTSKRSRSKILPRSLDIPSLWISNRFNARRYERGEEALADGTIENRTLSFLMCRGNLAQVMTEAS